MRYSVVGLGKLGCSMAAAIASRGHDVVGYDIDARAVDALAAGRAPVDETGLQELITEHRGHLTATQSLEEAVHASDVTFIVVPTPSDERGAFELTYAAHAFGAVGAALATKRDRHTVVLTSTVLPGSMRYGLIPALEAEAGRAIGDDIGVCYSPAFIALGSVIRDFLNPDFVLIGESSAAAGDVLAAAYREILPQPPPVRRMSLENAELTKIAVNTFVTTKISFANMLADLCSRIPGGDVDVVTDALGMDRRIGRAYLTGALGYGGPCFPRDNHALSFLARELGSIAPIAEATDAVNRALPRRIAQSLAARMPGATAGVLGLAYKPDTRVVEESQSVQIAQELAALGMRVVAHDPLANGNAAAILGDRATLLADPAAVIAASDVVLVTMADPAYTALGAADFARDGAPRLVVDFWRCLRGALDGARGVEYHAIGMGEAGEGTAQALRRLWAADVTQALLT